MWNLHSSDGSADSAGDPWWSYVPPPKMTQRSFDEQRARDLLQRALDAHAELNADSLGPADEVRANLQGLALIDGLDPKLGARAMGAARALKGVSDSSETASVLGSVSEALEFLRTQLLIDSPQEQGAVEAAEGTGEPNQDVPAGDEEPARDEGTGAKVAAPSGEAAASEEATASGESDPSDSEAGDSGLEYDDSDLEYMDGSSDPLLADFLTESQEHLEAAEEHLLVLEESPDDPDALGAIFRSFHTVKGGAGILDLDCVSRFAHSAESVLDLARNGGIQLKGHPIDQCYHALDILGNMFEGLASGAERFPLPRNYKAVLAQLDLIATAGEAIPRASAEPEESQASATELGAEADGEQASGADSESGDSAASKASEKEKDVVPRPSSGERKSKKKPGAGSVKIATDRLDNMVNLVGELVIATAMVQQEIKDKRKSQSSVSAGLSQLGKVTTELQHIAMSMRMVPLKATFQRAARLVRDVALKCGKKVHFDTAGEDTELDRNVVEQLGDPLIHMLRNAVDHGVEDPEQRAAAGKTAIGEIRLEAYHESGNVVIVLSDDGAGMNRERILAKAIRSGLVTEKQAEAMPNSEVWQLIFHPGLSTAEKVSSVSGRGVGMDVVKKNIEALRGSVEIDSTPGEGSRVLIRLPLTLAIIDAMVVVVGSMPYILPTLSVQSFLRPTPDRIFSVQDQGEVLSVRDRILPIYHLSELLGIDNAVEDPTSGLLAITSAEGHEFALLVDDLKGQQQVVIKSMGSADRDCAGVSGAAILGDGLVGLILDPAGLVRLALAQKESVGASLSERKVAQ